MCQTIIIPNVDRDERIGSAFNHLFRVIKETEECDGNDVNWDFEGKTFFHPFFLAPLALYKNKCGKTIGCINQPNYISSFLELIHFEDLLHIDKDTNLKDTLTPYLSKTYIPICCFDICNNNVDSLQTIIQGIIEAQCKLDTKIRTPLSYFLGELICNISEHSHSKVGYIFSQYLSKEKCVDLVIADSGITVFNSYVNTQKYLDEIGDDEAEALKKANEGYSTKDLPDAENRGYGIISTKSMLVDGLGGSFFMLSGSAFHRHDRTNSVFINLPDPFNWEGTIILMRIPVEAEEGFDYNKYIQ